MKRYTRMLTFSAIAVVALGTPALAAVAPSPGASAAAGSQATVHVRHFHVKPISFIDTHRPGYVAIDADFNAKGKRVGSDVTTCRAVPGQKKTARCDVGLGLAGGLITIRFTESSGSKVAHGRITGGTGQYLGVYGRVVIEEHKDGADVTATIRRR